MSWLLDVNDQHTVGFGIDSNGSQYIYGDATTTIFFMGREHEIPERIRNAGASWCICTPDSPDVRIDGNNYGLLERVRNDPENMHGMTEFYAASEYHTEDLVAVHIAVPRERFGPIMRAFELAMLSRVPMGHTITVPFYGFRVPQATTSTPTIQEFMEGHKPLLFDEVEFTARRLRF
ncbi:hypothetical protein WI91_10285 [Burkholderia vietnamiensis]|uniref:hypothetical protein n=1 Tax=Burkholderia vietnamiensis TaxID=60552 RepID=UPI00075F24E5|nr:hypothetical protein [Burkholderia vietnamiensis]KVE05510.1 hypothetical protein WI91_10285 [Burkholderia vietnamiensis]